MKLYFLLISFFFGCGFIGQSQENRSVQIDGRILNTLNNDPIAFANIINYSTNRGTISNMDGYFKIGINSVKDSIVVSFIGFKNTSPVLIENKFTYNILLQAQTHHLGEITIRPDGNNYLYTLVENCRKNAKIRTTKAKAYFELKSYNGDKHVELVEGFYNIDIESYDIKEFNLKAGRLARQLNNNRYFASLESSKAIMKSRLINGNREFPKNPLEFPVKKMQETFELTYENSYINETGDSIYVIAYSPLIEPNRNFTGKIWVNASHKFIEKIEQVCLNAAVHPFLALYKSDHVERVDLHISKSFTLINGKTFFKHVDFDYTIDYKSRADTENEFNYTVTTNAVVHAYDYNELFYLPKYPFDDNDFHDYVQILALPYNDYFWEKNTEFKLNDESDANSLFFNSPDSHRSNVVKISPDTIKLSKLYLAHYPTWSEKRIWFRDIYNEPKAPSRANKADIISEKFKLSTKLYLDFNQYDENPHFYTSAIFDTYNSYYKLPMDQFTQCFINMYFDLAEMERRQFLLRLPTANGDPAKIDLLYDKAVENLNQTQSSFQRDVQRGTIEREMVKWNRYIFNALGIDNLALFNPYEE
jgi:hypothetical protein